MADVTKKKIELNDRVLFDQFVHDVEQPFQAYKAGSNINRVLYKCNYKKHDDTEREQRVAEIITRESKRMARRQSIQENRTQPAGTPAQRTPAKSRNQRMKPNQNCKTAEHLKESSRTHYNNLNKNQEYQSI